MDLFSRFIWEMFLLELVMHVCKSEDFEVKTMVWRLDKGEEKHKYESMCFLFGLDKRYWSKEKAYV